jgi:uncharacterized Zn-finger protein
MPSLINGVRAPGKLRYHLAMTQQSAKPQPIAPPEVIEVDTLTVACDGGGPSGHPRVFLPLTKGGETECPYCDRIYKLKPGVVARH